MEFDPGGVGFGRFRYQIGNGVGFTVLDRGVLLVFVSNTTVLPHWICSNKETES